MKQELPDTYLECAESGAQATEQREFNDVNERISNINTCFSRHKLEHYIVKKAVVKPKCSSVCQVKGLIDHLVKCTVQQD